jgi:iron(III) transport system permease protein
VVGLPVLSIFASFVDTPASVDTLRHLASTIIPQAVLETAILGLGVVVGVVTLGAATGWIAATCEFPGRRVFEWAAAAARDAGLHRRVRLHRCAAVAGPVRPRCVKHSDGGVVTTGSPNSFMGGGAFVFSVVLYPYVYLLARTAFLARTASMIDAARSLGLTPWQTWWQVNIPLARPSIAAGALLALMETLADYGASVYFGLQTFTVAIYRAWFALGDRVAASQLAAVLSLLVLGILALERHARGRARFFTPTASQRPAARAVLRGAAAAAALAACLLPVLLGFVLPVVLLLRLLVPAWGAVDWSRYLQWLVNTIGIGVGGAAIVLITVMGLAYAGRAVERGVPATLVRMSVRLMSLGYALPGAVIAVGILIPLATLDNGLDGLLKKTLGVGTAVADRERVCAALRLPRALFRGRLPVGRGRTFPHHADDGCQRAQPR